MIHETIALKKGGSKNRWKQLKQENQHLREENTELDLHYQKTINNIIFQAGTLICIFTLILFITMIYLLFKFKFTVKF